MSDNNDFIKLVATLLASCMLTGPVLADPWTPTGDMLLRQDVQLLADAGVLASPVTTWPITWATLAADLSQVEWDDLGDLPDPTMAALLRLRRRLDDNQNLGGIQPNASVSARTDPFWLRTFEDTPREENEIRAGVSWMGDRFAVRLQGAYTDDPLPSDQNWRMDGSYAAMVIGNHILSAGAIDRWWGPSWDNTLVLSNNARPVGGFALERNVAKAFETKWLSWIGPWTYSFLWGFLGDDREVPNSRLVAFRVGLRPFRSLEIGLSRAATWCGSGRPCDGEAFWDIVIGNDNVGESGVTRGSDRSNQLAAIDARWHSPLGDAPYALYTQWVANDEVNGFPSQWFGQAGAEYWGELDWGLLAGSYVAHVEVSSTICEFWENEPSYDCAYNHNVYRTGYRYERRALGAAADGDSIVFSAGLSIADRNGHSWNGLVRWSNINRNGDNSERDLVHSVSSEELKTIGLHVSHSRSLANDRFELGRISVGLGYQHEENEFTGGNDDDLLAFLQWTWDMQSR